MIIEIDLIAKDIMIYRFETYDSFIYWEFGHKDPFRVWEKISPLLF